MMILRYSAASPYARKILIAAELLGLSKMLTLEPANTADPNDSLRKQNPLGKIPTLILENGRCLYDSRVIVDYFDQLDGQGRLIPTEPLHRIEALRLQALGDGVNDAALALRYETTTRPDMLRDAGMIAHQQEKIDRALSSLNFDLPPMEQTIGCISIACALGYLDLRFEGAWRKNNHHLADWLSNFECHTPIYASTKP